MIVLARCLVIHDIYRDFKLRYFTSVSKVFWDCSLILTKRCISFTWRFDVPKGDEKFRVLCLGYFSIKKDCLSNEILQKNITMTHLLWTVAGVLRDRRLSWPRRRSSGVRTFSQRFIACWPFGRLCWCFSHSTHSSCTKSVVGLIDTLVYSQVNSRSGHYVQSQFKIRPSLKSVPSYLEVSS